jgi:hypothetical protein
MKPSKHFKDQVNYRGIRFLFYYRGSQFFSHLSLYLRGANKCENVPYKSSLLTLSTIVPDNSCYYLNNTYIIHLFFIFMIYILIFQREYFTELFLTLKLIHSSRRLISIIIDSRCKLKTFRIINYYCFYMPVKHYKKPT